MNKKLKNQSLCNWVDCGQVNGIEKKKTKIAKRFLGHCFFNYKLLPSSCMHLFSKHYLNFKAFAYAHLFSFDVFPLHTILPLGYLFLLLQISACIAVVSPRIFPDQLSSVVCTYVMEEPKRNTTNQNSIGQGRF